MSTRALTWTPAGPNAWQADYAGTGPFEHWLRGKLQRVTIETTDLFEEEEYADGPPELEVVDTAVLADVARSAQSPPFATLRWYGRAEAIVYTVKRWNGAAFVDVDTVPEIGQGYYRWEDDAVPVATERRYQVTATDEQGNESAAIELTVLVAGIPQRPAQSFAYEAGTGDVTVTAAVPA